MESKAKSVSHPSPELGGISKLRSRLKPQHEKLLRYAPCTKRLPPRLADQMYRPRTHAMSVAGLPDRTTPRPALAQGTDSIVDSFRIASGSLRAGIRHGEVLFRSLCERRFEGRDAGALPSSTSALLLVRDLGLPFEGACFNISCSSPLDPLVSALLRR